jgi:hypothetical protein
VVEAAAAAVRLEMGAMELMDLVVVKEEVGVLLPRLLRQEHLGKEIPVVLELVLVVMLLVEVVVLAELVEMLLEPLREAAVLVLIQLLVEVLWVMPVVVVIIHHLWDLGVDLMDLLLIEQE